MDCGVILAARSFYIAEWKGVGNFELNGERCIVDREWRSSNKVTASMSCYNIAHISSLTGLVRLWNGCVNNAFTANIFPITSLVLSRMGPPRCSKTEYSLTVFLSKVCKFEAQTVRRGDLLLSAGSLRKISIHVTWAHSAMQYFRNCSVTMHIWPSKRKFCYTSYVHYFSPVYWSAHFESCRN